MKKDTVRWNIEAVTLIFIVLCVFLSFYLALVSFYTLDEAWKKQLVVFAASFLISGVTIFLALVVHLGMKKAISRTQEAMRSEVTALTDERS